MRIIALAACENTHVSLFSKRYDSSSRALISRARTTSPFSKALIMSPISGAIQWVPTPTTPTAPTASNASVSESSPL